MYVDGRKKRKNAINTQNTLVLNRIRVKANQVIKFGFRFPFKYFASTNASLARNECKLSGSVRLIDIEVMSDLSVTLSVNASRWLTVTITFLPLLLFRHFFLTVIADNPWLIEVILKKENKKKKHPNTGCNQSIELSNITRAKSKVSQIIFWVGDAYRVTALNGHFLKFSIQINFLNGCIDTFHARYICMHDNNWEWNQSRVSYKVNNWISWGIYVFMWGLGRGGRIEES